MSHTMRSVAFWTGVTVLVGLSALGLRSAVQELDSAETLGQQAATATNPMASISKAAPQSLVATHSPILLGYREQRSTS